MRFKNSSYIFTKPVFTKVKYDLIRRLQNTVHCFYKPKKWRMKPKTAPTCSRSGFNAFNTAQVIHLGMDLSVAWQKLTETGD